MALVQAKQEALTSRSQGLTLPNANWAEAARKGAVARLGATGLPIKRDEYWRYTNPAALTAGEAAPVAVAGEEPGFASVEALKIVFTDGVFDAAASDDLAAEGLEIGRLADATVPAWVGALYGTLETAGQTPVERPLAALNTAYATDGIFIRATGVVAKPVSIVYNNLSTTSDAILHHVVKLEEGAVLTLLESGAVAARFNTVLEAEIADQAALHHIRTQGPSHEPKGVTHSFARLGSESLFKTFTLTANGKLTRNEAVIELLGANGRAHIAGATLGNGKDFHQDDTLFITHGAPGCESRQVFKKVLRNGATGVFQGKILVKQIAQKTDGYQMSQSLLLDDDAQFLAKPELEIYADDVKCSHGSTSGAIDETARFYLQSRGLPKKDAEALLVLAFLAGTLEEIEDEAIAGEIQTRLEVLLGAPQE